MTDTAFPMHSAHAIPLDLQRGTPLLGGLSPTRFMQRHWQRRPLLVRGAFGAEVAYGAPLDRQALFALAADEDVASRLIVRGAGGASHSHSHSHKGNRNGNGNRNEISNSDGDRGSDAWTLRHGPFSRRALPPLSRPGWTLLVQGVDRRVPAARALLDRFRFVPDARLDDVMVSYASDGGGVGPHLDSYDVFLLQVRGHRRWQVAPAARAAERAVLPGLPLRILAQFSPQDDWLLAPGDMLYLPPGWAHDGTAVGGDCMTCSIGFRAPSAASAGRETLARVLDAAADDGPRAPRAYRDPGQPATGTPAAIPEAMAAFVRDAALRLVDDPKALDRAIGVWLSEPHDDVWFEAGPDTPTPDAGIRLDDRTRLLYDVHRCYINGTAVDASRRDVAALHRLADERQLDGATLRRCGSATRGLVDDWLRAGWLHRR